MSELAPIPLIALPTGVASPEFDEISGWPFEDEFVGKLLREDIPQRAMFQECRIWIYRDPEGRSVGFGTLDICDDYRDLTSGARHPYIPLLAVNPQIPSMGYGTSILGHLVEQATGLAWFGACHDVLFLDVYMTSTRAIKLYDRCGFARVAETPLLDPAYENREYLIMARRLKIAQD